jgi:hypothetical protein
MVNGCDGRFHSTGSSSYKNTGSIPVSDVLDKMSLHFHWCKKRNIIHVAI